MPSRTKNDPTAIRMAGAADAGAIADLHTASWREVYRGILPDRYLDHEIVGERRRYWSEALAAPTGGFVLIACHGKTPSGFIAVTRDGEPGFDAVIDSLHVAAASRGTGLGRRLMGQAAARLLEDGASSVCLRVFDANTDAIRFYRRLGGRRDGTGIDGFAGANMPDTRYGWRDLAALRYACTDDGQGGSRR
jgi:ribosomal protein S18 acetylase RimI-like enzyme